MASENRLRAWLVIQAKKSEYADVEGNAYEYPPNIPHGRQIGEGDVLVVSLPKTDAPDGRRVVGLGRIGRIVDREADRLLATYERYLGLSKPATFEDIGGDPRRNQTN